MSRDQLSALLQQSAQSAYEVPENDFRTPEYKFLRSLLPLTAVSIFFNLGILQTPSGPMRDALLATMNISVIMPTLLNGMELIEKKLNRVLLPQRFKQGISVGALGSMIAGIVFMAFTTYQAIALNSRSEINDLGGVAIPLFFLFAAPLMIHQILRTANILKKDIPMVYLIAGGLGLAGSILFLIKNALALNAAETLTEAAIAGFLSIASIIFIADTGLVMRDARQMIKDEKAKAHASRMPEQETKGWCLSIKSLYSQWFAFMNRTQASSAEITPRAISHYETVTPYDHL